MVRKGKKMGTVEIIVEQNCQNCDFEDYCDHKKPKPCKEWRPDLDYKRMMEALERGGSK